MQIEEVQERDQEKGKPPKTVTVTVNKKPVVFEQQHATGLQIKQTAIAQGINIQPDFALFEEHGENGHLKPIGDDETVSLNKNSKFRAVAPDDNS